MGRVFVNGQEQEPAGQTIETARRCWCGISTTESRPCVFHGGDLRDRVEAVLRHITVIDTLTSENAKPARAFLAWFAWSRDVYTVRHDRLKFIGDVEISYDENLDADPPITTAEMADLLGEAIMGRWPW